MAQLLSVAVLVGATGCDGRQRDGTGTEVEMIPGPATRGPGTANPGPPSPPGAGGGAAGTQRPFPADTPYAPEVAPAERGEGGGGEDETRG